MEAASLGVVCLSGPRLAKCTESKGLTMVLQCPTFSRQKTPISLSQPHIDELDAKLGHIVSVGDMVE